MQADLLAQIEEYRKLAEMACMQMRTYLEMLQRYNRNVIGLYSRVKPVGSILHKVKEKGCAPFQLNDVAGLRVVCNYLSDLGEVVRFVSQLTGVGVIEIDDMIASPSDDGYRAVHLDLIVRLELPPKVVDFPCELQIRTAYQHSWAEKSHHLKYKGEKAVPPALADRLRALSELLYDADRESDRIREEIGNLLPLWFVKAVSEEDMTQAIREEQFARLYEEAFPGKAYVFIGEPRSYIRQGEIVQTLVRTITPLTGDITELDVAVMAVDLGLDHGLTLVWNLPATYEEALRLLFNAWQKAEGRKGAA